MKKTVKPLMALLIAGLFGANAYAEKMDCIWDSNNNRWACQANDDNVSPDDGPLSTDATWPGGRIFDGDGTDAKKKPKQPTGGGN